MACSTPEARNLLQYFHFQFTSHEVLFSPLPEGLGERGASAMEVECLLVLIPTMELAPYSQLPKKR